MLSLQNFTTTVYSYELELKRIDSNTSTPNRAATIHNLNMAEIERFINNLRKLVLEIAQTLDVDKIINDVIEALQKRKLIFDIDPMQAVGTSIPVTLYGKDYTITRLAEDNGCSYEIDGFESTSAIITQVRYKVNNQIVDVDIRFNPTSIVLTTFEPLSEAGEALSVLTI